MTTKLRAASFQDGAVTTAKIAADAITNAKMADDAIHSVNIAAGAVDSDAIGSSAIPVNKLNIGQIGGRRNIIINGAMEINQRSATSGVTSGYFVDRFRLSGCSASAVITSNTPTAFPTAITVSATSGNPIVTQRIESKAVKHLSGKTVTASFFAKNVSNATTLYTSLQYAGSADNFGSSTTITEHNLGSLTSDWVQYTASWTVPAGGLNGLALNILCAGSSTFTMGVTGVQLEVGSQATEFEHRSFGEELALCQRYYYKSMDGSPADNIPNTDNTSSNGTSGIAMYSATSGRTQYFQHPVQMRADPTVTVYSSQRANTSGRWGLFNHSAWVATATSSPTVDVGRITFSITHGSSLTAGYTYLLAGGFDADAEI